MSEKNMCDVIAFDLFHSNTQNTKFGPNTTENLMSKKWFRTLLFPVTDEFN